MKFALDMFEPDGRARTQAPCVICDWCCADKYNPETGRCPRCNEPWYDSILAWPGPTTLTMTPCPLRFGGGSMSPSDHLGVVMRMILHRGLSSELARAWRLQKVLEACV